MNVRDTYNRYSSNRNSFVITPAILSGRSAQLSISSVEGKFVVKESQSRRHILRSSHLIRFLNFIDLPSLPPNSLVYFNLLTLSDRAVFAPLQLRPSPLLCSTQRASVKRQNVKYAHAARNNLKAFCLVAFLFLSLGSHTHTHFRLNGNFFFDTVSKSEKTRTIFFSLPYRRWR